ncbi:transcriptional regulator domain-containing protein [Gluconacetobacter azotocaptans]|uniref:transcriptional regulator domain-containing protein n=1 Tax=Gluconacetobacter azotocaptans TaxID=142834 RepID=UPI0038D0F7E5
MKAKRFCIATNNSWSTAVCGVSDPAGCISSRPAPLPVPKRNDRKGHIGMEKRLDWNSPEFLGRAMSLDLPDFAQEFLSLNEDYVRGYQSLMNLSMPDAAARHRNLATFARPWGLRFPR